MNLKNLFFLVLLIPITTSNTLSFGENNSRDRSGPWADELIFRIYTNAEDEFTALKIGEINIMNWDFSQDESIAALELALSDSNLLIEKYVGDYHYSIFDINCDRWPTSNVHFRRSLAHLVDKVRLEYEVLQGFGYKLGQVPPLFGSWKNPDLTTYEYNPQLASAELELSGFIDTDNDGIRNDPLSGENMAPVIFYIRNDDPGRMHAGVWLAEELEALGVPVEGKTPVAWAVCAQEVMSSPEGRWNIFTGGWAGTFTDPLHLAQLYHSKQFFVDALNGWRGSNYPGFKNNNYDYWADILNSSSIFTEILEAAYNCQKIFAEQVPGIPIYGPLNVILYQEGWTGIVNDIEFSSANWWNTYKMHPINKEYGGTIDQGIIHDIETLNPLTASSTSTWKVLDEIFETLYRKNPYDPSENWPGLAESWSIEEWTSPLGIPGIKVSFKLVENAEWHDGERFTAEDVKFSFEYIRDQEIPRYTYALNNIEKIVLLDDYNLEISFDSTSYFVLEYVNRVPILPKHIWEKVGSSWSDYDPVATSELIGLGPWKFVEYKAGEYVRLEDNEKYIYYPRIRERARTDAKNLMIQSDFGSISGDGFHEKGSMASFSVLPTIVEYGIGVRKVFTGWVSSSPDGYTGPESAQTVIMNDDITEIAVWKTQSYLTVDRDNGGLVSPSSGWYDEGSEVTIKAEPSSGYLFDSWSGDGLGSYTGKNNVHTLTINGPITQTANFIEKQKGSQTLPNPYDFTPNMWKWKDEAKKLQNYPEIYYYGPVPDNEQDPQKWIIEYWFYFPYDAPPNLPLVDQKTHDWEPIYVEINKQGEITNVYSTAHYEWNNPLYITKTDETNHVPTVFLMGSHTPLPFIYSAFHENAGYNYDLERLDPDNLPSGLSQVCRHDITDPFNKGAYLEHQELEPKDWRKSIYNLLMNLFSLRTRDLRIYVDYYPNTWEYEDSIDPFKRHIEVEEDMWGNIKKYILGKGNWRFIVSDWTLLAGDRFFIIGVPQNLVIEKTSNGYAKLYLTSSNPGYKPVAYGYNWHPWFLVQQRMHLDRDIYDFLEEKTNVEVTIQEGIYLGEDEGVEYYLGEIPEHKVGTYPYLSFVAEVKDSTKVLVNYAKFVSDDAVNYFYDIIQGRMMNTFLEFDPYSILQHILAIMDPQNGRASLSIDCVETSNSVRLKETQHKLYLHVYDNQSHHVGLDPRTMEFEIGIPGANHYNLTDGILIMLPADVTEFNYVVDASFAHEDLEVFNVTVSRIVEGDIIAEDTKNGEIEKGDSKSFESRIDKSSFEISIETMIIEESSEQIEIDEVQGSGPSSIFVLLIIGIIGFILIVYMRARE